MAKTAKVTRAWIGVFGFAGCSAWITAGLLELFAVANVAAGAAPRRRGAKAVRFDCYVIGASERTVRGSHDVSFAVRPLRRRYDAVVVPPIWCESRAELVQRARKLHVHSPLLRQLARRSTIIAGACSGTVLLAHAGLLADRRATTCWWLADWFRHAFPDVELAVDRLLVRDGNCWTAAAGSAYVHLGLELVRELAGDQVAGAAARLMLVEPRRGSQSPFMTPETLAPGMGDADVQRAARYLSEHAGAKITIPAACRALGLSERTLVRKFQASAGTSPLGYLQSRRIARARQLLETSSLPLKRIIEECGYEDLASFRKLFARQVGMTPREYRSRFRTA